MGAAALCLLIYLLRLDSVAGLIVDDAWYVLLAKALATGQGYTLINSPSPGIVPFYPPAFSALLSLVFRVAPEFPQNVWLLKSVSVAAMMGTGVVACRYFARDRALPFALALGLAVAAVLLPGLVFLATSTVMSECFFTLVQFLTIIVVERAAREGAGRRPWAYAALGAALAALALLTRAVAIGLVVAAAIYLVKERRWRPAVIFAAVTACLVGPWMIYSRAHRPTPAQRMEQGGNIVEGYAAQFWQRTAGQGTSGEITAGEVPDRVWKNASEILRYDLGAFVFYPLFRPLEPGERMRIGSESFIFAVALSLLLLAGYVSVVRARVTLAEIAVPLTLAVTMLWGWEQFRLLLPVASFFLFYMLMGVQAAQRLLRRLYEAEPPPPGYAVPTFAVWFVVALYVYANAQYLQRKHNPVPAERSRWAMAYEENRQLMAWAQDNLPQAEVLATQNPPLVHLFTGHKTVAVDDPAGRWEAWNQARVRYLVRTSPYRLPNPDAAERKYRVVRSQGGELNLRVVDLGPPASRLPWGASVPPAPVKIEPSQ